MKSNNDWQIKNLKDICTSIIRGPFGSSLKKEFFITKNSMSYKVYEQKNAIHSNAFIGTYYISKDKFQKLKRFEVKANDIIMSCSGTIGKLYTIPENAESGIINQALLKFTLNNKLITNSFFLYYLKTIVDNIEKKGSGIQNIGSVNLIKKLKIPIPPIYIQEQIVKELDALSDIITKKKEQIAELDKLAQATFYDMFGDPIKNEKNWCIKKIGAFSSVGTGATPNRQKEDIYFGGNIPWVKTTEVCGLEIKKTEECITEQALKDTNCKLFPINTILLAMYGQGKTRGQVGLLKIEATTNQACAAIFPEKEVNNKFLYLYLKLNYQYIRSLGRGGNQENLNLSLVKSIPVIIPPIFLQNQFAKKIEAIEQQKALINKSITDVQLLFDYTMDKYFN